MVESANVLSCQYFPLHGLFYSFIYKVCLIYRSEAWELRIEDVYVRQTTSVHLMTKFIGRITQVKHERIICMPKNHISRQFGVETSEACRIVECISKICTLTEGLTIYNLYL